MSELLSPERVDEIRAWCEPMKRTSEEVAKERALCEAGECFGCRLCMGPSIKVAGCNDVLALCDTVESLRAGLGIALGTANEVVEAQNAEIVELRADRKLLKAIVDASHDELDLAMPAQLLSLQARIRLVRTELETLRGIATRVADDWRANQYHGGHWHDEGWHSEPMTKAEWHILYGQRESDDE